MENTSHNTEQAKVNKILGINDEVTTCECCGRINLKHTVVISFDGGSTVGGHFGCVCASKIMKTSAKATKEAAKSAQDEADRIAGIEKDRRDNAEFDAWQNWLIKTTGKRGIREAVEMLGGFSIAKKMFRAEVAA